VRRAPQFEELVGDDLPREERERLERMHKLLVNVGPPPRLRPELEVCTSVPAQFGRSPRQVRRGVAALAAAAVAVLVAGGYLNGHRGSNTGRSHLLPLAGTREAPNALASLQLEGSSNTANRPMELSATGLPQLPPHGLYEVYLVRHGRLYAQCGSFVVTSKTQSVSVTLNNPYPVRRGDTWVITRELEHMAVIDHPIVVLRPTT
jgi:hypothetical protein